MNLNGKVVFITGASRGIGEACARLFAGRGARVILTARSAQALERVGASSRGPGGRPRRWPRAASEGNDRVRLAACPSDARDQSRQSIQPGPHLLTRTGHPPLPTRDGYPGRSQDTRQLFLGESSGVAQPSYACRVVHFRSSFRMSGPGRRAKYASPRRPIPAREDPGTQANSVRWADRPPNSGRPRGSGSVKTPARAARGKRIGSDRIDRVVRGGGANRRRGPGTEGAEDGARTGTVFRSGVSGARVRPRLCCYGRGRRQASSRSPQSGESFHYLRLLLQFRQGT